MKTFKELIPGDIIYRLQFQTQMDYNYDIIPYVENVDKFIVASTEDEFIWEENYREITYYNSKECNGCYIPNDIVDTDFWEICRYNYNKEIGNGICYSTDKTLLIKKRKDIIKASRADIEKELNKIRKVEKQLLNILEDVKQ